MDGLDKLNLNNCFLDPSFVREKAAYELCDALGVAAGRTNYAALYINGEYWGLYLLVEQQDQEFLESRHGGAEDGNLWKGEPYGSLEYLGAAETLYHDQYELKTNEETNDWSDLVDLVEVLNNTPLAALPDSLHERVDINSALAMLAVDIFTVNLDSYVGRCANYYLYHRALDSRFYFTKWDQNESFGVFNMWNLSTTQLQQLSPWWTNPQPGEDRPLAERLLTIPQYQDVYLGHMQRLMAGAADPDVLVPRLQALRGLIRPWVEADPNLMFTVAQFEACMTSNVYAAGGPPPGRLIPALATFIQARHAYLESTIGAWTPITGLVINEVMPANGSTLADEAGDFDDWVEIANVGPVAIDLTGLGLTDHHEGTVDFVFPAMTLNPGEYLVVWCDEEPEQGAMHAPFKLDADGEDVYLTDGGVIIDQVTFPSLSSDIPWGRFPDGDGDWGMLSLATPGAENQNPEAPEDIVLYINEFLALNQAGLQDETGAYEDWVELYNPGPEALALGGLFLTDDLALTTQWALPDVTLEAGGHLVIWCDNDPEDGPLHATFKRSGSGEAIGIFARLLPCYPNPFNPRTTLALEMPSMARARLDVMDARGRLVATLVDGVLDVGRHEVVWHGCDRGGRTMPSGVYFSRLSVGGEQFTGRMVLVR